MKKLSLAAAILAAAFMSSSTAAQSDNVKDLLTCAADQFYIADRREEHGNMKSVSSLRQVGRRYVAQYRADTGSSAQATQDALDKARAEWDALQRRVFRLNADARKQSRLIRRKCSDLLNAQSQEFWSRNV